MAWTPKAKLNPSSPTILNPHIGLGRDQAFEKMVMSSEVEARKLLAEQASTLVELAREDPNVFMELVMRDERTGAPLQQAPVHEDFQLLAQTYDRLNLWAHAESGKALLLTTPIPTPRGWVTLADLRAGDDVFSGTGEVCTVQDLTPIQNGRKVYRVEFDDGDAIFADGEHNWLAHNILDRASHRAPRVVTTNQMREALTLYGKTMWSVPLAKPVQYPRASLPIDPYVLGAWLGDGNSATPSLTFHEDDRYIYDRCCELEQDDLIPAPKSGYVPKRIKDHPHLMRGVFGSYSLTHESSMSRRLAELGVLGKKGSKFIPAQYLCASVAQRRELLAGLLDTDGYVTRKGGNASQVEFTSTEERLGTGVLELARSLGFKARIKVSAAKLYGRVVGTRYRVFFTAREPAFRLPRKLAAQQLGAARHSKAMARYVVSITEVPSSPVRCIKVDSPDHTFLAGHGYTVTHNCEGSGAMIAMADGTWRPIETLKERCRIVVLDPIRMCQKVVEAGPVEDNGMQPVLAAGLESGRCLFLTHEHPLFLTVGGWRPAKLLNVGDEVLVAGKLEGEQQSGHALFHEEAEILGFFIGTRVANSLNHRREDRKSAINVQRPNAEAGRERLRSLCREWFHWEIDHAPDPRREAVVTRVIETEHSLESPLEFAERHGVEPKRKVAEMLVPDSIWKSGDEIIRSFLAAFWRRGIHSRAASTMFVTTSSLVLCQQIALLMLRVGIQSRIYRVGTMKRAKPGKPNPLVNPESHKKNGAWRLEIQTTQVPEMKARHSDALPLVRSEKITSITKMIPRQTWALPVHDDCHCYLSSGVISHNTTQLSIGHVLWRIGRNPNLRVLIVSNTSSQATKIVRTQRTLIETSPALKAIFPSLRPGNAWADTYYTVKHDTDHKDYTVQALGIGTDVLGARTDLLVLDDILDAENTRTPEMRKELYSRIKMNLFSRLTSDAQVICVGTAWNREDFMHSLATEPGWESFIYSIVNDKGEPRWPAAFTRERIEKLRAAFGPVEFARMYLCDAKDDKDARFQPEWIEMATRQGAGRKLPNALPMGVPQGYACVTGVDLAVKEKAGRGAKTVFCTILVDLASGCKELIGVESGRWGAPEIIRRLAAHQERYSSTVWVETNAAQVFLVQMVPEMGYRFPVNSFITNKNKNDPTYGVESIAAEMSAGRWIIPSGDGTLKTLEPEVKSLVDDMVYYSPGDHTGDFLMALWIAREGSRIRKAKAVVGTHNLLAR